MVHIRDVTEIHNPDCGFSRLLLTIEEGGLLLPLWWVSSATISEMKLKSGKRATSGHPKVN